MRVLRKKKFVIPAIVGIVALVGGVAFAYFTTAGSGTGSAQVGTNSALVVNETGVSVYNSTIAPSSYVQDQCLQCVQASQFGNEVTLTAANQLLSTVVVGMRSWDATAVNWPITFNIYSPTDLSTPIATDTQNFAIPAAVNPNTTPTAFNITFNFDGMFDVLPGTIVYGISFPTTLYPTAPTGFSAGPTGAADGLNIALSSSASDISVGTDPYPGTVFINTSDLGGFQVDAGTCINPTLGVFSATDVWCGATNPHNYGAYGSSAGADIPAVQINVAGTGNLYPGGPAQTVNFTVYNPGSTTEALNAVAISVTTDPSNGYAENTSGNDITGCYASWFTPTGQTWTGGSIASGATVPGAGSISMTDTSGPQDACQGASLSLTFTAS
jgi:hypothetical protein